MELSGSTIILASKFVVGTNGTVGGLRYFTPSGARFFQWLGVTRASDSSVPCGHRLAPCLTFSILIRKGMVSYAAPK